MANEKRLIYLEDAKEALIGWETDPTDDEIEYTLDNLPKVDAVEVVHGRWVQTTEPLGVFDVMCGECSNCHESFIVDEEDSFDDFAMWKYCPNCGAKMDKNENP